VEERAWCWPWSCGYDEYRESCQCCTRTARVLSTAVELCCRQGQHKSSQVKSSQVNQSPFVTTTEQSFNSKWFDSSIQIIKIEGKNRLNS
jgi:hypothetical protein